MNFLLKMWIDKSIPLHQEQFSPSPEKTPYTRGVTGVKTRTRWKRVHENIMTQIFTLIRTGFTYVRPWLSTIKSGPNLINGIFGILKIPPIGAYRFERLNKRVMNPSKFQGLTLTPKVKRSLLEAYSSSRPLSPFRHTRILDQNKYLKLEYSKGEGPWSLDRTPSIIGLYKYLNLI